MLTLHMNQKKACTGWGAESEKRLGLDHLSLCGHCADSALEPAQVAKRQSHRK